MTWLTLTNTTLDDRVFIDVEELATIIETVKNKLYNVCLDAIFEINDEKTRNYTIKQLSKPLNLMLKNMKIVQYEIICDEENNTDDVIESNDMIIEVYVVPKFGQIYGFRASCKEFYQFLCRQK